MAVDLLKGPALHALRERFAGEVLLPGDPGYDEARRLHNSMIDRRPAAIARCRTPADVQAAVDFAREEGLPLSIRAGGHGVSGSALCDDGVCLDLTPMKGIEVRPAERVVRVEAGATWGELDAATQEHGLAVTGGRVSTTGVAGLTLGTGSGWLERKLGFACDNLLAVDVVLSDGRALRADAGQNADLLWALKGGGGNFAAVTAFEFGLHEIGPILLGGLLVHPPMGAGQLLRDYRDFMAAAPDEVGGALVFLTAPDAPFVPEEARGQTICAIVASYAGPVEEGERALAPLRAIGTPVVDMVAPMPYVALQQMIDEGNQSGNRNYWKAEFLEDLSDAAIDALVPVALRKTSPLSVVIVQPLGGATARVPAGSSAVARRDAPWVYHAIGQWADDRDDQHIAWARDLHAALAPFSVAGVQMTYTVDGGEERSRAVFGDAWERIVAVKTKYDPIDLFDAGAGIHPAAAG